MYRHLQLKNNLGADRLSQIVLQGRMPKMKLKMMKIINNDVSDETFINEFMNENDIIDLC